MIFTAKLTRGVVWKQWRMHHRVGGQLGGVHFKWMPGNDYISAPLASHEVERLKNHRDIIVEMRSNADTVPEVVERTEPLQQPIAPLRDIDHPLTPEEEKQIETPEQFNDEPTEEDTSPDTDNVPAYVRRAQRQKK